MQTQAPSELRQTLRADWNANRHDARSRLVMVWFRLASAGSLPRPLRAFLRYLYRLVVIWVFGIELPVGTRVGPGLTLLHATGLVVNGYTVIGANCDLKQNCTLGLRRAGGGSPVLGDNVVVGSGAQILGPVTIGSGAQIGAGAIVLNDVPAGHTAVGNPARVLPLRNLDN